MTNFEKSKCLINHEEYELLKRCWKAGFKFVYKRKYNDDTIVLIKDDNEIPTDKRSMYVYDSRYEKDIQTLFPDISFEKLDICEHYMIPVLMHNYEVEYDIAEPVIKIKRRIEIKVVEDYE